MASVKLPKQFAQFHSNFHLTSRRWGNKQGQPVKPSAITISGVRMKQRYPSGSDNNNNKHQHMLTHSVDVLYTCIQWSDCVSPIPQTIAATTAALVIFVYHWLHQWEKDENILIKFFNVIFYVAWHSCVLCFQWVVCWQCRKYVLHTLVFLIWFFIHHVTAVATALVE